MNRRHFLQGLAASSAALALPLTFSKSAKAQALRARNLVVVVASGGWDSTMVLDPKLGLSTVDSAVGDIRTVGGRDILSHSSRPMAERFFNDFGDRTAIVNGLQVRSVVHSDGMRRVLTGDPTGRVADVAALVAGVFGQESPIPYLSLGVNSLPGPLVALSGKTGAIQQVTGLVRPEAELPHLNQTQALTRDRESMVTRFLKKRAERRAPNARGRIKQQLEEYVGGLDRMTSFKQFVQDTGAFQEREFVADLRTQASIGVRALSDGLSHTILMEQTGFDTHAAGDPGQTIAQEMLYDGLHVLMAGLEAANLTEDTAVLVVSELGRTPMKNGQGGKDHWPVSSALVIGGGVTPGTYGGTDDTLNARGVDLVTGQAGDGQQLQPGNLISGVMRLVGVDASSEASDHPVSAFNPMTAFIS